MAGGDRGAGIFNPAKSSRASGRPSAFQGKAYQWLKSHVHRDLPTLIELV